VVFTVGKSTSFVRVREIGHRVPRLPHVVQYIGLAIYRGLYGVLQELGV
jgi:hypothetical protein